MGNIRNFFRRMSLRSFRRRSTSLVRSMSTRLSRRRSQPPQSNQEIIIIMKEPESSSNVYFPSPSAPPYEEIADPLPHPRNDSNLREAIRLEPLELNRDYLEKRLERYFSHFTKIKHVNEEMEKFNKFISDYHMSFDYINRCHDYAIHILAPLSFTKENLERIEKSMQSFLKEKEKDGRIPHELYEVSLASGDLVIFTLSRKVQQYISFLIDCPVLSNPIPWPKISRDKQLLQGKNRNILMVGNGTLAVANTLIGNYCKSQQLLLSTYNLPHTICENGKRTTFIYLDVPFPDQMKQIITEKISQIGETFLIILVANVENEEPIFLKGSFDFCHRGNLAVLGYYSDFLFKNKIKEKMKKNFPRSIFGYSQYMFRETDNSGYDKVVIDLVRRSKKANKIVLK